MSSVILNMNMAIVGMPLLAVPYPQNRHPRQVIKHERPINPFPRGSPRNFEDTEAMRLSLH